MLVLVYILRFADGSYYVGNTRKTIEARLWEHNHGLVPGYTATRRPVELAHAQTTESLTAAFARERQIKGWSRRKKEALIHGQPERLVELSKSRTRQER